MNVKEPILFFITTTLLVLAATAQAPTVDSLAKRLFEAIKTKDAKAFQKLYPSQQRYNQLIRQSSEKEYKSPEMLKMMADIPAADRKRIEASLSKRVAELTTKGFYDTVRQGYQWQLPYVISNGEERGIRWSETTLTEIIVDSVGYLRSSFLLAQGRQQANGQIHFSFGDSTYVLRFQDAFYAPDEGGWFAGQIRGVLRKGEKEELETVEITLEETLSVEPPPPPPPPKAKSKKKKVRKT